MLTHNIALQNFSTVVSQEEVVKVAAALSLQSSRDLSKHWGVQAEVRVLSATTPLPDGWWRLGIFDNSDQAGALGYHDLTAEGQPQGKVFAGTDLAYGLQWSCTASHELLEMLVDPFGNTVATNNSESNAQWPLPHLKLWALEIADPVEDESYGYEITAQGFPPVLVSNFVLPEWFCKQARTSDESYDFRGLTRKPLEVLPLGYIAVLDVALGVGWTMETGSAVTTQHRAPVGSRREKRTLPQGQWARSKA